MQLGTGSLHLLEVISKLHPNPLQRSLFALSSKSLFEIGCLSGIVKEEHWKSDLTLHLLSSPFQKQILSSEWPYISLGWQVLLFLSSHGLS